MKFVRILILLLILAVAVYSGWFVYGLVFELLDFQIGVYKVVLSAGEQIWAARDAVWGIVEQAIGMFGDAPDSRADNVLPSDISSKLAGFERKLKLVSGVIWAIVWLLVWKVLSDIVFGLKNSITKITEFVR